MSVLITEDFENGADGWSTPRTEDGGATFSSFLGRFGNADGAGILTAKTFDTTGGASDITITFDFYEIDNWDNDTFSVFIDGVEIFAETFSETEDDAAVSGSTGNVSFTIEPLIAPTDLGFDANADQIHRVTLVIQNPTSNAFELGFGSTFTAADEEFGIDNIVISRPGIAVDDALTVDENETQRDVDGDVLSNDNLLNQSVSAVDGSATNITQIVQGSNGGTFRIATDGRFDFSANGDFDFLRVGQTATTSITYELTGSHFVDPGSQTVSTSGGVGGGDRTANFSFTAAENTNDGTTPIAGDINFTQFTTESLNVIFVVDVSGSTGSQFNGAAVGDVNGDGASNTILDAQIAALQDLSAEIADFGFNPANVNIGVVSYSTDAVFEGEFDAGSAALDAELETFRAGGRTDFDDGLDQAFVALTDIGADNTDSNVVFFLSDGVHNEGPESDITAARQALENTFNASVIGVGVGNGTSLAQLNLVDNTDGAEIVNTTDSLDEALEVEILFGVDISDFRIFIDGQQVQGIDASDLIPNGQNFTIDPQTIAGLTEQLDSGSLVRAEAAFTDGTVLVNEVTINTAPAITDTATLTVTVTGLEDPADDTDGDGIVDLVDIDDDNDGILDINEGGINTQVDSGIDGALGIDDGVNDNSGVSVSFGITSNDPDSTTEAHILDSITIDGVVYSDFIMPDAYQASAPDGSQALPAGANVRLIENSAIQENLSDPNYEQIILTEAFQSQNLNAYQELNNGDFSNAAYTLTYDQPVLIAAGGFIAISERGGNNSTTVTALDEQGNVLGTITADRNVDYLPNAAQQNNAQDAEIAVFALDDLGQVGRKISQLVVTFPDPSTDAPDGKIFIFGDLDALVEADTDGDGILDRLDLDSDNDGITDNVEAQTTQGYVAPTGSDSDNDGLDDAYDQDGSTDAILSAGIALTDTDSDGTFDVTDTDSDEDGVSDADEAGHGVSQAAIDASLDADRDGLKDVVEGSDANDGFDINDENLDATDTNFQLADSDGDTNADGSNAAPTTTDFDFRDDQSAPVAADDTASTDEDNAVTISVLVNDSDADGDTLSVSAFGQGANGTVTDNGDGTLTYTPDADFNGSDSFTYTVSDGNVGTDTATVNVTVNPVNDAPVAADDTASTDEDTAVVISVLDNDTDIDGDTLSVLGVSQGTNGATVRNGDGTVTYTPDADFNGTDTFTYIVSDGNGGTDAATVTVTVDPVTDPTTLTAPASSSGTEDTPQVFSQANGNAITVDNVDGAQTTVVLTATGGTMTLAQTTGVILGDGDGATDEQIVLTGTAAAVNAALDGLIFDPTPDFNGTGGIDVNVIVEDATGSLQNLGFEAPDVADGTFQQLNETLVDGWETSASDDLIEIWGTGHQDVESFEGAQHAEINATEAATLSQTFTPVAGSDLLLSFAHRGRAGDDTMRAEVIDLGADGVAGGGDDTVLFSEEFTTGAAAWAYHTRDIGSATGNVVSVTFEAVDTAGGGAAGNFLDAVFLGTSDLSQQATIDVIVTPVADVADDNVTVDEDNGPTTFNVLTGTNGAEADNFEGTPVLASVTQPTNGTVTFDANGDVTYTPDADFNGTDTFTYTAESPAGITETATVTVTVNPVNDAPVAVDDVDSTDEGTAVVISVLDNDTDIDGDTLSVLGVSQGTNGATVRNGDGTITYTPDAGFNGTDSFTYIVSDGNGGTDAATVTVTVDPVNDAPVAADDTASTDEDNAVTISVLVNDSDADGDTLSVSAFGQGANGTVTDNADGTLTYTPDADFNGSDSFTYTVSDGNGGTDTATVNVTVNPVNDAPDAVDDSALTDEDTAVVVSVLLNDSDVDGDTLSLSTFGQGANGTVTDNGDGTLTYTPDADFNGSDSFTYSVSDGNGGTDTATVNVTVTPVNDGPVAVDDADSTDEGTAVVISVLDNDTDIDGDTLSVLGVSQGSNGATVRNGDGTVTYKPNAGFSGTDTFTYILSDGNGGTDAADVTVTVSSTNDAPTAVDDAFTTVGGQSAVLNILDNDSDPNGDILSISALGDPSRGTVVDNGDGTVTYTPNAGFFSTESFTYTISDGNGGFDTATVDITQNFAPIIPEPVVLRMDENETEAGRVAAFDFENDTIEFAITGGADGALFTIDQDTGDLSFINAPDFETPLAQDQTINGGNTYFLEVTASDPFASFSSTIEVVVQDVDENPNVAPDITTRPTAGFGDPDAAAFLLTANSIGVVADIAATDTPGDILEYRIFGEDIDKFDIDIDTGEITLLDFQTQPDASFDNDAIFELDVVVTDQGGLQDLLAVEFVLFLSA
ncbi:MAG: tandem-95 repeat protein [Pseudomonadota bacterium]